MSIIIINDYEDQLYYDLYSGSSLSWYIDTIICQDRSYSCFKDCFIVLSNKEDCPNYEITCSKYFDLEDFTLLLYMVL